jgi:hypothetical protein
MSMEHSDNCPHCRMGCTHPHEADDPITLDVEVKRYTDALSVRGSKMRRGGPYQVPGTNLTIGTDEWRQVRCPGCGMEAMTPLEMIPPMCEQDNDGAYLGWCPGCMFDISTGHRPGHGAGHRRRRRRS